MYVRHCHLHELATIQLLMEYDPAPPFRAGHPRVAEQALVDKVKALTEAMIKGRWEVSRRAAGKTWPT